MTGDTALLAFLARPDSLREVRPIVRGGGDADTTVVVHEDRANAAENQLGGSIMAQGRLIDLLVGALRE